MNHGPRKSKQPAQDGGRERKRQQYLEDLRQSTRALSDRVRRSEQLTAEDLAVRINAIDV